MKGGPNSENYIFLLNDRGKNLVDHMDILKLHKAKKKKNVYITKRK